MCQNKDIDDVKKMLKRKELYKEYGYDQDKSREFVLAKSLPIQEPILEIGTGKGHMAILLAKNAKQVVSVDVSKAENKLAELNAVVAKVKSRIKFVFCDAVKLPYFDLKFGTVVSVNAFHHFEEPFAVLHEMIRVCQKKLVIADFNEQGFEVVRKIHKSEGREHEEKCGDFSVVGVYLQEHGFKVKKYNGCGQIVYVGIKNK